MANPAGQNLSLKESVKISWWFLFVTGLINKSNMNLLIWVALLIVLFDLMAYLRKNW
jgi:hypothetical protein